MNMKQARNNIRTQKKFIKTIKLMFMQIFECHSTFLLILFRFQYRNINLDYFWAVFQIYAFQCMLACKVIQRLFTLLFIYSYINTCSILSIYFLQFCNQYMDDSDTDNSNMFKVDHSKQHQVQNIDKRIDQLFGPNKKILNDQQPRKVLYGPMEQQPRTVYQIVKPYLWKMAQVTGQAATTAGKGIFQAIKTGAQWAYDKLVNNVVPYAAQEIPKLIFIIKNGKKNEDIIKNSESFHVLQIEEDDYNKIKKNQEKKTKKRIIVPLGANQDPQFAKFLEKQNFVPNTSFPIGVDSDQQSQSFMVPSAKFMLHHNEAIKKNTVIPNEKMNNVVLQQYQSQQIKIKPQKQVKIEENKQQKEVEKEVEKEIERSNEIKSIIDNFTKEQEKRKDVQNYKRVEKKFFKLQDCYIFELEGQNSIQYDLLDGIQRDDNTKCGYLVKSTKFNIQNQDGSPNPSGEAPLLVEKIVDKQRKVKVEIPAQNTQENTNKNRKEQKQIYLA